MATTAALSRGSIAALGKGAAVDAPVVQVRPPARGREMNRVSCMLGSLCTHAGLFVHPCVLCKRAMRAQVTAELVPKGERFKTTLHDGSESMSALLASQLSDQISAGAIKQGTLLRLNQFVVTDMGNAKVLMVSEVTVLGDAGEGAGAAGFAFPAVAVKPEAGASTPPNKLPTAAMKENVPGASPGAAPSPSDEWVTMGRLAVSHLGSCIQTHCMAGNGPGHGMGCLPLVLAFASMQGGKEQGHRNEAGCRSFQRLHACL